MVLERIRRQANAKWLDQFDPRFDPNGRRYFWMAGNFVNFDKGEDNDEWAIANNYISIMPCQFDLTARSDVPILNEEWEILLSRSGLGLENNEAGIRLNLLSDTCFGFYFVFESSHA